MPMNSSFLRNYEKYNQILQSLTGTDAHDAEYQDFLQSISDLNDVILPLTQTDQQGRQQPLTQEQLNLLRESYSVAMSKADQFMTTQGKSSKDKGRRFMAREFASLLTADRQVLDRVQPDRYSTLDNVFRRTRTLPLDITGSPASQEGNMNSSRIPVSWQDEQGRIHKAFFTQDSSVLHTGQLIDEYRRRYPGCGPMWDAFAREDPDMLVTLASSGNLYGSYLNLKNLPADSGDDAERRAAANEFGRRFVPSFTYDKNLEATSGSSVPDRNCAMSAVASLLGQGGLLANSRKAVLRNGDVTLRGCVTEQARGSDLNRLQEGDAMLQWGDNGRGSGIPALTADAMRQIADLQVLDYICGNIDRHNANILYRFDTTDPQNPRLCGITGIDNDASFGIYSLESRRGRRLNEIFLSEMGIISQSMAAQVMSLSGDMLMHSLQGYRLSSQEKEAAVNRLHALQQMLTNSMEHYRDKEPGQYTVGIPRIIPDSEFEVLTQNPPVGMLSDNVMKTTPFNGSLFQRVKSAAGDAASHAEAFRRNRQNGAAPADTAVKYTGAVQGRTAALNTETIKADFSAMKKQLDELADRATFGNSREFKAMQKALTELSQCPAGRQNMREAVSRLNTAVAAYIQKKSSVPGSDLGKDRLHLARQLQDKCIDTMQDFFDEEHPYMGGHVPTFRRQMKDCIDELADSSKLNACVIVTKAKSRRRAAGDIAGLIYAEAMRSQLDQPGNARLLQQLSEPEVIRQTKAMLPAVKDYLTTMSLNRLEKILRNDVTAGPVLYNGFLQYKAAQAAPQQANPNPQRAAQQAAGEQANARKNNGPKL